MGEELNALALGYAAAIVSASVMLLLGILGNLGVYMGAVQMMMDMHAFFSLGPVGIIAGMVEAAVVGFVLGYAFGWVYNRFV
jgi:hypothetical protein